MLASRLKIQNLNPPQLSVASFTLTISSPQKLRAPKKMRRSTAALSTMMAIRMVDGRFSLVEETSCIISEGGDVDYSRRWVEASAEKERSTDLAVLCSQACTLPQVLRQTGTGQIAGSVNAAAPPDKKWMTPEESVMKFLTPVDPCVT